MMPVSCDAFNPLHPRASGFVCACGVVCLWSQGSCTDGTDRRSTLSWTLVKRCAMVSTIWCSFVWHACTLTFVQMNPFLNKCTDRSLKQEALVMFEFGHLVILNVVLLVSRWKEHASPAARRSPVS